MPFLRAALAALLLLLGPRGAPAQDAAPADPAQQPAPLGGGLPRRCGVCHVERAAAPTAGRLVFSPPGKGGPGDAAMCYSCHNGVVVDGRRSQWTGRHHPATGSVSCGSCHTPHAQAADVGTFMRFPRASFSYCSSCHPGRRVGDKGEHPAFAAEKGKAQDCGACHVVHGATGEGLIRTAGAEALCGGCHGENPSRPGRGPGTTTHPIGKTGPPCLGCHRVHRTVGGKAMLDKAALDGRLCYRCHERSYSATRAETNHPVSGDAACLSCHRMHNAEKPAPGGRRGLLAVAWAEAGSICLRCHEAVADTKAGGVWNHPVGVPVPADERSQATRLGRSGAFFAPGGKVTCLSCHRAHGGSAGTPQLVRPREALCLYCHPDQNALDPQQAALGAHPVYVRPRRARVDAAFLNAGGVTGPRGELTCSTCHRANGGRAGTAGMVLPRESYSCLLCHSRETSIASTAHSDARAPGSTQARGTAGLCGGCHGEHGWRVPLGEPSEGTTAIERICLACHGGDAPAASRRGAASSHPLGTPLPPGRGAAGLPLFWSDGRRYRRGVMTCATCHDVHRNGPLGHLLRKGVEGGRQELCAGCHPAQNVIAGTKHDLSGAAGRACGPCHPVHDPQQVAGWPSARGGERSSYDLTGFCLTCHRAGAPAGTAVVAERSHPAAPAPGAKPVGCGACHDPHRWNPSDAADRGAGKAGDAATSFLVRAASGPADLCAGCHAEQAAVVGTAHDLTARPTPPPGIADPRRHGVCSPCHRIHGPQPLAVAAPTPAEALKAGEKVAPRPDPCEVCHAPGKLAARSALEGGGHPVGVELGQDYGPDLPLYGIDGRRKAAGRIACSTCHDPHRWEPPGGAGTEVAVKAATSFLRLAADGYAPLCFPCHADKSMIVGTDHDLRVTAPASVNLAGETAERSGVCGACHAVHHASPALALWNRRLGDGKDDHSRACTGCHRPGNDQGARVPPRAEAHLVNYPGRGLVRQHFSPARSTFSSGSVIALFAEDGSRAEQGYLTCASCHDVHRWESDVSSSGSGLPVEGDATNSFLRVTGPALERTVCAECHAATLAEYYRRYHFPEGR